MNNLDKLKNALIENIKNMNPEKFYELMNILEESNKEIPGLITENALFSCRQCRQKYGECEQENNTKICFNRFKMYIEK